MNKNYIILNIKSSGEFNPDNETKIISIESMKIDKKMKLIDEIKLDINEKSDVIEFINFCNNCNFIIYDAKKTLPFILKMLYKNNIYDKCIFKYIDIMNMIKDKKYYDVNKLDDIYIIIDDYLNKNNMTNLDELLFNQQNHGLIFRGLNYPKYLCDIKTTNNKYYGYIIDFTKDKYVSYYSCLKELKGDYFDINEIIMLKNLGAKVILNISYLCEEIMEITNYYSIQAVHYYKITSKNDRLLKGINNYIKYKKENKNLKLILWGNIDILKENYDIVDKTLINEFIKLIDIIKEPWNNWSEKEI